MSTPKVEVRRAVYLLSAIRLLLIIVAVVVAFVLCICIIEIIYNNIIIIRCLSERRSKEYQNVCLKCQKILSLSSQKCRWRRK